MATQNQLKLFKALADCADEFLGEILSETRTASHSKPTEKAAGTQPSRPSPSTSTAGREPAGREPESGTTRFFREELKRETNPVEHPYAIIRTLNAAGVMVSIDYEPGGTYSVSMLRRNVKLTDCWSSEFLSRSTGDLLSALRQGAIRLGITL